jgi:2-oxoglutarate ferredoxin oxidoreductase subunit alpha
MNRGKVLSAEDLKELGGFGRYRDVDGDGITYRTLPGNEHYSAAYFTRGTGHNEDAVYSEKSEDWEKNLVRLARKYETIRTFLPKPIIDGIEGTKIGFITYGSSNPAVVEARDRLKKQGVEVSTLRLRALPFSQEVEDFIEKYDRVYIIENNFNGQLCQIFRMELPQYAAKLVSLAHCDGLPLTARWIVESFQEKEKELS